MNGSVESPALIQEQHSFCATPCIDQVPSVCYKPIVPCTLAMVFDFMHTFSPVPEKGNKTVLKWVIFFRILFSVLLLGSTIVLQLGETTTLVDPPLLMLYGFIVTIFLVSLVYILLLKHIKKSISLSPVVF